MKCKKCGFDTPNNSNFCSHCGSPIDFDDEFISIDSKTEEEKNEEHTKNANENMNQMMNIDTSRASIGWYFLGFFFPLAGIIIFFFFLYKKPDLAFKARRGAIHGVILSIALTFLFIITVSLKGGL